MSHNNPDPASLIRSIIHPSTISLFTMEIIGRDERDQLLVVTIVSRHAIIEESDNQFRFSTRPYPNMVYRQSVVCNLYAVTST
jgi:hypothetical protein